MFTLQQIQEIAKKLSSMSKKDSDFKPLDTWKSLNKQDFISFIKNGNNRTITIDQLYTYVRQNINGDIGNALERITVLETIVNNLSATLKVFIGDTNLHFELLDNSINNINNILSKLTTKYTITVNPITPDATVFINGVEQTSMSVTYGSTINVKVKAEGYDTYEEFILVEEDITITPELKQSQVTFTITANPSDSIVTLNGVVRKSITVPKGTLVNWSVSKDGYITKSGIETVDVSYTLPVTLTAIGGDEINFTINVLSPSNAVVTINEIKSNTVVVKKGEQVTWSVEAPHYTSQNGSEVVNEDTIKNITLTAEQVTLTINPTPSDAKVELNGTIQKSITVDYNTNVSVKVSKDGYKDYEESYVVTTTETKDITLVQITETSWTNLVLTQADNTENPIDSVLKNGGRISLKAEVTAHLNDGSTKIKDVTSQVQWSVEGEGCTSNDKGVFTWIENPLTSKRSALITANVTGPGSSNLKSTIQTIQLGSNETLIIEPSTLIFESAGGVQELQIKSNTSWSIE